MSDTYTLARVDDRIWPDVRALRYRVYVEEKKFAVAGADPATGQLSDPADPMGVTLALFDEGRLVSSVQVIPLADWRAAGKSPALDLSRYVSGDLDRAVMVSKLVSDPSFRGSGTLGAILRGVLHEVKALAARWIIIIAEPQMAGFYKSMGFQELEAGLKTPDYGDVCLMAFDMRDPRHKDGDSLAGWMFRDVFQALYRGPSSGA